MIKNKKSKNYRQGKIFYYFLYENKEAKVTVA